LPINPYAPPATEIELVEARADFVPLARPSTRFMARMLDTLVTVAACLVGAIGFLFEKKAIGAVTLAVALVAIESYQWFLITSTGRSLGKRWCGIKIVQRDGRPINFVSGVLLREWIPLGVQMIPTVGSVLGIVDSLFIFRDDRRCLHDLLAGTKVVDAR